jgi:hypothetical protein
VANRGFAAIASALAAVLMVGCGGDDSADTAFPPGVSRPIAKVEFLRDADRICESTNARIEAAADELVGDRHDPPPAEVRRIVVGIAIPALEAEVRAIRALGAPAGDERRVEAIVAATERGIEQIRSDPAGVLDGPPQALREASRLALAYGSSSCDVR